MQLAYLLKGLALSGNTVVRVVAQVPAEVYDEKTDPDRFSLREAVAHLADWDTINLERLRRGVEDPGCTVMGIDESARAVEGNYQESEPVTQAELFAHRRETLVAYLQTLTPEDWSKTFRHSEKGEQTVYEYAVNTLGHDMVHLEHLTTYLP